MDVLKDGLGGDRHGEPFVDRAQVLDLSHFFYDPSKKAPGCQGLVAAGLEDILVLLHRAGEGEEGRPEVAGKSEAGSEWGVGTARKTEDRS